MTLKVNYQLVNIMISQKTGNYMFSDKLKCSLLHFVAFYGVASLFVSQVDNRKEGVDNRKVK